MDTVTPTNVAIAYRLFEVALNRAPDAVTLGYLAGMLDAGLSPQGLAQDLVASPEYAHAYGAWDDTTFVTRLYENALHREPDGAGLVYILGNLATGTSRAEVLLGFAQSPEFASLVPTASLDYLPTLVGTDGADRFTPGATFHDIQGLAGIDTMVFPGSHDQYAVNAGPVTQVTGPDRVTYRLTSVERLQFSDATVAVDTGVDGHAGQAYRLYEAAFGRAPDMPGFLFQLSALDQGASWDQIAANFLASPEFTARYGNVAALDDLQFLTLLHHNISATTDSFEIETQLWQLQHGASRGAVLTEISESYPVATYPAVLGGDPQLSHGIVLIGS